MEGTEKFSEDESRGVYRAIHDLGYFDLDNRVLEPLDNPFGPRLLPM